MVSKLWKNYDARSAYDGYFTEDNKLRKHAAIISGILERYGKKKLLEIGRTMMTDAKLVLLDEPGAGVNPTLMLKIIDMIRRLNTERGYTFCIIEHDMDLIADLCQKVVVLSEGQVLTEGPMSKVKNDERVIQAYFGGGVDI